MIKKVKNKLTKTKQGSFGDLLQSNKKMNDVKKENPPLSVKNKHSGHSRYIQTVLLRLHQGFSDENIEHELRLAFYEVLDSKKPLPEDMALELKMAFKTVLGDTTDPLFTPRKKPGGREHPWSKDYIGDAISYLNAVSNGIIIDKTPIKTVAEAFDVDQSTVRKWNKKYTSNKLLSYDKHKDLLKPLLIASGLQYRNLIEKRTRAHKPY